MTIRRRHGTTIMGNVLSFFPGRRFDVREFHHELLKVGYVPLDILEEVVIEWIESKKLRHRTAHAPEVTMPAGESIARSCTHTQSVYVLVAAIVFKTALCR